MSEHTGHSFSARLSSIALRNGNQINRSRLLRDQKSVARGIKMAGRYLSTNFFPSKMTLVPGGAANRKLAERQGQVPKPDPETVRKRKSWSGGGEGWGGGRTKLCPIRSTKNDGVSLSNVSPAGGFKRI